MKRNVFIAGAFVLASGLFILSGCSKDDTTAPIVTLTGSSSVTVVLNGTYTEDGATANDEEDGAVTVTNDQSSTNPDVTHAGTYTITYSATDAAGNTGTAVRTVNVVITRANYVWANFNASDSSQATGAFTWSGTISAGIAADAIVISGFSGTAATCSGTVNGAAITIPSQTVGPFTIVGTGTMDEHGTKITLEYVSSGGPDPGTFYATLLKL